MMKYKFETEDEIEAKQLISVKDLLSIIWDVHQLMYEEDKGSIEDFKSKVCAILNRVDIDVLWN